MFQRRVERVHACGPRPIGELLSEILVKIGAVNPALAAFASERIERYAELAPNVVRDLGADQFGKPPLHVVKP